MAELGVIASIVGIAGVGIKLSKTLYQVGHKTVSADHNIHTIAKNVTLFSQMLKQVAAVLRSSQSLHTPEAIETVEGIVAQCENVFDEITRIVVSANNAENAPNDRPVGANGRRRRLSVLQRAKWYFEQPKVDWLLAQLECLKTTLSIFIQTLSLAALTASLRQAAENKEELTERIASERMHVETLIMARQLSVVIVNTKQREANDFTSGGQTQRPTSPAESEATIELPRRQMIANEPANNTLTMVRLDNGDLDILDGEQPPDVDSPVSILENAPALVDQLLRRWTRIEEPLPLPAGRPRIYRQDIEQQQTETDRIMTPNSSDDGIFNAEGHAVSAPDLKLHPVESLEKSPPVYTASPVSQSPNKFLEPKVPPPPRGGAPRRSKKSSRESSPSPPSYSPQMKSIEMPNEELALMHITTNPETDHGLARLETFQDHHSLVPYSAQNFALQHYQPQSTSSSPGSPTSPSTMMYYTHHRPNGPLRLPAPPQRPSNYRSPFVTSRDSDSEDFSGDSDDSQSKHHRRRNRRRSSEGASGMRRYSNSSSHAPHDSGFSNGLNIPWRIRTDALTYYDFIDARLLGPRTPIAPPDPRPWIFKQAGATTELSKEWVDIQAIREMGFRYEGVRFAEQDTFLRRPGGDETGLRILQPLDFPQIEALVNRTVELFKQRRATAAMNARGMPKQSQKQPPAQQPSQQRPQAPSPSLGPQPPQPSATQYRSPQLHPSSNSVPVPQAPTYAKLPPTNHPYPPAPGKRSVSFQSSPRDRSPRTSDPAFISQPSSFTPGAQFLPPGNARAHPNWADAYKDNDGHDEARWARDRERQHERHDRGERDRSWDDRPTSRGKGEHREHRGEGHRRREREREREREKDREREADSKKKKSKVAVTMAKIGGIAALLEGLDGI